jgi:cardiolipin synthase A/B
MICATQMRCVTIDDHIGLVGTSNMDIRSFVLNAEHILVIHDPGMTSRLKTEQRRYIAIVVRSI